MVPISSILCKSQKQNAALISIRAISKNLVTVPSIKIISLGRKSRFIRVRMKLRKNQGKPYVNSLTCTIN